MTVSNRKFQDTLAFCFLFKPALHYKDSSFYVGTWIRITVRSRPTMLGLMLRAGASCLKQLGLAPKGDPRLSPGSVNAIGHLCTLSPAIADSIRKMPKTSC